MKNWLHTLSAAALAALVVSVHAQGAASAPMAAGPGALKALPRDREGPTSRVKMRGPTAVRGTASGLSMAIQIGENRVYRFDNLTGTTTLDLGELERGWNTFRLYNVSTFSMGAKGQAVPLKTGLSCSGGFEVDRDKELEIVLTQSARGLKCTLR